MRFIPTRIHAVVDYLTGVLLIVSPWLFGFAVGGVAQWLPVVLGAGVIVYSLVTDYEYSATRALSMPAHLGLDAAGGALLAVSPWLFGFADIVYWPHLIIGLFEIATALTTRKVPSDAHRDDRVRAR